MTASQPWHELSPTAVLEALDSLPAGLPAGEPDRRRAVAGPNLLQEEPPVPWWRMLAAQFQDFMVLVLVAATGASYALGERADALTIIAIVIINAVLGFVQEYRAERSLAALKQLSAPTAAVRRGGSVVQVPAADLVPGDIVLLEAGDRVPADARLLQAFCLEADEAALTGESIPVRKDAAWAGAPGTPLGDRRNMVYMGTAVTTGRGEAVVTATGMNTEVGRIAGMIQEVEEGPTPLQRRLEQLGRWLVAGCLGICALVVLAGLLQGEPLVSMFLTGVSLAVAAIPEGLPAIVTMALALGVQRMIRRRAIVRRLPAVETLGCATAILSDKTGTLTCNEMTVRAVYAGGCAYDVTGEGYAPAGEFLSAGRPEPPERAPALRRALRTAALCNNAALVPPDPGAGRRGPGRAWRIQGDPTEGALLVAAAKAGCGPSPAAGPGCGPDSAAAGRLLEVPFSPERRRMSVVVPAGPGDALELHLKGAPDTVLARCTRCLDAAGREQPLTPALRDAIMSHADRMAARALRVLAMADRPLPPGLAGRANAAAPEALERDMVFLGLAGMIDPPRPEVRDAIGVAAGAGIRTAMITGDHPATALAVARELGIAAGDAPALTGADLEQMTDRQLAEAAGRTRVFARVSPQHKLRIVRAFKARGEIVAMTGDGVNDAPAVKEADIGVAMGQTGTDVTREASQLVLADDNYATIVAAVEEGRGIYDNIRKFIRYLLACNTGEMLVMFLAALARLPLPLLPMQILWVNLVTDGLPAMALGVDPPDADVMRRPPRAPGEGVFSRGLARKILGRGLLIGVGVVLLFVWGYSAAPGEGAMRLAHARTLAFAGLVMAQLFHVFDCRSERRTIWEVGWLTNRWLVAAVASSVTLLLLAIYWGPLARLMDTVPLSPSDWLAVIGVAGAGQVLVELRRVMLFRRVERTGWQKA